MKGLPRSRARGNVLANPIVKQTVTVSALALSVAGTTGDHCWDSTYVYVCVATDTWKRAALATW